LASRVLRVLAFLAPDALPEDVLAPLADEPMDVEDALTLLASYSMITRAGGEVSVHRLVQAITRSAPASTDEPSAVETAIGLLADTVDADPWGNPASWPRWNALLPHIDTTRGHASPQARAGRLGWLVDRAATYLQGQGQLGRAISLFEAVLADRRRVLGDDHPDTLTSRHNLACAYQSAGRLAEATAITGQTPPPKP
jgi:hypothetical protein